MKPPKSYLTKREQEIMECLFREGSANANELMVMLSGNPSNSSVRTQLRILEEKNLIHHEEIEGKFIYTPVHAKEEAAESALSSVVKTFFRGSISQTVAALISSSDANLSEAELAELEKLIAKAKEEGR